MRQYDSEINDINDTPKNSLLQNFNPFNDNWQGGYNQYIEAHTSAIAINYFKG